MFKKKTLKKLIEGFLSQSKRKLLIPLILTIFFGIVFFLIISRIISPPMGGLSFIWIFLLPLYILPGILESVFPSFVAVLPPFVVWGIIFAIYYFLWYTVINKKIRWLVVIVVASGVLAFHPYFTPETNPPNLSVVGKEVAEMAREQIETDWDLPKLKINILNITECEPPCFWRVNAEIIYFFGSRIPHQVTVCYRCPDILGNSITRV